MPIVKVHVGAGNRAAITKLEKNWKLGNADTIRRVVVLGLGDNVHAADALNAEMAQRRSEAQASHGRARSRGRRREHVQRSGRQLAQPKDNEPREVPIGEALRPWPEGPRQHERWVFPSRLGSRFAFWPKLRWEAVRNEAKLKGGVHQLRHTHASHFLKNKPDLVLLAAVLGHSDTSVTKTYQHHRNYRGLFVKKGGRTHPGEESLPKQDEERPCPIRSLS